DTDFLFAGRLHVENRTLQHTLESERGLDLAVFIVGQTWRRTIQVFVERVLEPGQIGSAGTQDLTHLGRVENGQQQMLDREELMASFTRLREGVVQTEFELLR